MSDPSFCGDNQLLEDVELEGNITKQQIDQKNFNEEQFQFMA